MMANENRTLYAGMTNDLSRRVSEHKNGDSRFTATYGITKLVWFESYTSPQEAIAREKQIKGWIRSKKLRLIEDFNPGWDDLSGER